jgi:peptidoglycan hydrolase-like protein with peptidoglycan-binding domain
VEHVPIISSIRSNVSFTLLVIGDGCVNYKKIIAMKRFLIATGVAVLALASVAGAQGYVFNTNLTVGSTGADVVALQSFLQAKGYSIPALASGAAQPGYFGSQTKAAVMAYQAANGIPNTGFFGPLTRASVNAGGMAGAPIVPGMVACPVGYVCTPVGGTPVTGAPVGLTPGTDGSVSVSNSTAVSSGQTVKKGETKNVVAIKLKATAGPVAVNRVDVQFNERPWLTMNQVQLKNAAGQVLATKSLTGPSDVTEITVGSNYMVRFDGLNVVVTPGSDVDLVVAVSALAASDKIIGQTVFVTIPSNGIRTVNGLGISESVGGANLGSIGVGAASFVLSSTGSVADISTRLSPSAPATERSVNISTTVTTNDVTLGWFDLKAQNNSATLNEVAIDVMTNPVVNPATVFSNFRLRQGSNTYGASSFSTSTGRATFSDLTVNLAQDQWVSLSLVVDVAATSSDVLASSTLVASSIKAVDTNFDNALVGGVAAASATNDQTSSNTKLTTNALGISNASGRITQEIKVDNTTVAGAAAYTFTLTNNSNNNLFVSKTVGTFVNGVTNTPTNATSSIDSIEPIEAVSGDTNAAYIIPTGGSRTFTINGVIQKSSASIKQERMSISSIQYGTSASSPTGSFITSGLTTLTAAIVI